MSKEEEKVVELSQEKASNLGKEKEEAENNAKEEEYGEDGVSKVLDKEYLNYKRHLFVRYPHISCFRMLLNSPPYTAMPDTLTFRGTVKIDGTNTAVTYDTELKKIVAVQSRNRILCEGHDHVGFLEFVNSNTDAFIKIFEDIVKIFDLDPSQKDNNKAPNDHCLVTMFGEWAGPGIPNSKVPTAVETIPQIVFIILDLRVSLNKDTKRDRPLDLGSLFANKSCSSNLFENPEKRIYCIENYKSFSIDIDFKKKDDEKYVDGICEKLIEYTHEVVAECPFTKAAFGISGRGEGIVWKSQVENKRFIFKVKGEEFQVSKVFSIAGPKPDQLMSMNQLVDYLVTENRMNQGIQAVYPPDELKMIQSQFHGFGSSDKTPNEIKHLILHKKIEEFKDWVFEDATREEADVIIASSYKPNATLKRAMGTKIKIFYCAFMRDNFKK